MEADRFASFLTEHRQESSLRSLSSETLGSPALSPKSRFGSEDVRAFTIASLMVRLTSDRQYSMARSREMPSCKVALSSSST